MEPFEQRLKISNEQKKEVKRYLNSNTVFSEEVVLQLVRKIKQLEQRLEDKKYAR